MALLLLGAGSSTAGAGGSGPAVGDGLQLEDSSFFLLEDGAFLLLEA